MKTLIPTTWLRRWIAACLLLSMGVAMASPLVQPRSMELICAGGGGAKLVLHSEGALPSHGNGGMDCLLCLVESAPPTAAPVPWAGGSPLAGAPAQPPPVSVLVSAAALPPARAPPVPLVP